MPISKVVKKELKQLQSSVEKLNARIAKLESLALLGCDDSLKSTDIEGLKSKIDILETGIKGLLKYGILCRELEYLRR